MTARALVVTGLVLVLSACGAPEEATPTPQAAGPVSASPSAATASPMPSPSASPVLKASRSTYWENLKPGMCILVPDENGTVDITVTDCRAEHHAEVSLRSTLEGEDAWPGDDAIDAAAGPICEKALEKYVGLPYNESRLDWDHFTPMRDGWEEGGSRRVICLVFDPDAETTTASFKGSRQ